MEPTLVVLAAGIGSRYGGLKQLDPVGPSGELIVDYSVYDAIRAGFGRLVFVIRESMADEFRAAIGSRYEGRIDVEYAFQELDQLPEGHSVPVVREKPWGTGHAVLAAAGHVDTPFAVVNADDFYGQGSYASLSRFLCKGDTLAKPGYALVAYELRNTLSDHGPVARGVCACDAAGNLEEVVELTRIERQGDGAVSMADDGASRELTGDEPVSLNFWGFDVSVFAHLRALFAEFLEESSADPKAEFFLPAAIDTLIDRGEITCRVIHTDERWAGVTYREDSPAVTAFIRNQVDTGRYPSPLWGPGE